VPRGFCGRVCVHRLTHARATQYPSWLAHKRGAIPAEDHARYTRQSALVAQLLAVFDLVPEDRGRVMELMQEMQACGAPPQEIMSELAPGLTFGADGAPQFPPGGAGGVPPELANSCAQQ
jgi:peroxin-19